MTRYHFIGIGGIGMSALAHILHGKGKAVQGSDLSLSYVTEALQNAGVEIFSTHHESNLKNASTVIYGTDIKLHNVEYESAAKQKLPLLHRSELLAKLMEGLKPLLVTGTHGKTTTSSLLAHVLMDAGLDPTFALGGVELNTHSNGRCGKGEFFVAEADESDGSFLNYQGVGGIITNIEEDHLDFWKNREALILGFEAFAEKISEFLWWCQDDAILSALKLRGKSYGFSNEADLQITDWQQKGYSLFFDLQMKGKKYSGIEIPLLGKHNVLNAAAVFGLTLELGIAEHLIRQAFKNFKGVKRRMEKKGENRGAIIFDDYAHHPTEIKTTLEGLRKASGEKRIIAVFQPHRYTRLKECWNGFLECFDAADVVFVTDIYAARETPIEGLTAEKLTADLQSKNPIPVYYAPRSELTEHICRFAKPHDVIITLGAGDVTYVGTELAERPILPFKMAVLEGGKSAEHEVSLLSSKMTTEAINTDFYHVQKWTISKEGDWIHNGKKASLSEVVAHLQKCDLVFPILHGPFGEDGMIQGFLETIGVPYVGCDFRSCAVTMDKAWTKHIAQSHGIKIARFIEFTTHDWIKTPDKVREKILKEFQFPFFIKAIHLGSTFGVHRVKTAEQIDEAIHQIAKLDYRFLVEEEMKGREMEFGFIGDDEVEVSDAAEVVRADELHTYENKYLASGKPSIPKAPLPPEVLQQGRLAAETVYRAVGCSGLARIDFFLDPDGTWILNEVNPMPGLTPMSVYPAIWEAEGLNRTEVVDRIIIASLHRMRAHKRYLRPPEKPPVQI
ncbi:MAG: UDP-N-acetylmuramate--L-alanine ligase [Rhabdochlamydiaceae bacterium]|nr:UDP-N-acetylmuramate--L-alanine ligase [Rhabdochlamydiaceae bacterium]